MDRLLDLLHEDARMSVAQMATMLGEEVEAVQKRLADYERRGVIRGYQAVVNGDLLDDNAVHAVIELRIRPAQDGGFDKIAGRIVSTKSRAASAASRRSSPCSSCPAATTSSSS